MMGCLAEREVVLSIFVYDEEIFFKKNDQITHCLSKND